MKPWLGEDDASLIHMRNVDHKSWVKIGRVLDRSKTACYYRYVQIVPLDEQVTITARRTWTDEDEATILRLRNVDKRTFQEIADLVGMTIGQVTSKFDRMEKPSRRVHFEKETVKFIVPLRCLEDRARRMAIEPRDLTASFFNDPKPGYSALERRT